MSPPLRARGQKKRETARAVSRFFSDGASPCFMVLAPSHQVRDGFGLTFGFVVRRFSNSSVASSGAAWFCGLRRSAPSRILVFRFLDLFNLPIAVLDEVGVSRQPFECILDDGILVVLVEYLMQEAGVHA